LHEDARSSNEGLHGPMEVVEAGVSGRRAGNEEHVNAALEIGIASAGELTNAAPDSIAHHRVTGASANCDSYSGGVAIVPDEDVASQKGVCPTSPAGTGPIKVCSLSKPPFPPHGQNLAGPRPLDRKPLATAQPAPAQNLAATRRAHTLKEPVLTLTGDLFWLISTLGHPPYL
jgi:hypothetical protein